MALHLSAAGLEVDGDGAWQRLLGFFDCVLRGVGQVMFQNNSYAGLLFLIGLGFSSFSVAAAALLGTVISTLVAIVLGAERELVRVGMFGFNGALVGVALLCFLQPGVLTVACIILAAACSTIVMAAMLSALDAWKMPALTAPFVVTALCFLFAAAHFGRFVPIATLAADLPRPADIGGVVTTSTVVAGLFNGISQVFLQENVVAGLVIAAGLLVASRAAFAAALVGSLGGLLVAWGMGAAEPAIRAGAFGFNSVLTAIALVGFLVPNPASIAYALFAVIATPFVVAATAAALEPLGMPALTLPFVLVTWTFLFAGRTFRTLLIPRTP